MSLPPVPRNTPWTLKKGMDASMAVWSLQLALGDAGIGGITVDGLFGPQTERSVRTYQDLVKLKPVDGIAGPATQERMVRTLAPKADPDKLLPANLLRSLVAGESGNFTGAVNWMVAGGVDCGYTQRRVLVKTTSRLRRAANQPLRPYAIREEAKDFLHRSVVDAPVFEPDAVGRAFDSLYQFKLLRSRVVELRGIFRKREHVRTDEWAWRLAVLSHNYPAAADKISRGGLGGLTPYWLTPQQWVQNIGARFQDGAPVKTPLEWCQRYSLGSSLHDEPGMMVKLVIWT